MMGISSIIRKSIARRKAESRGINRSNFDKYWNEKEKDLGRQELKASREYEERSIKQKYAQKGKNRGSFKRSFKSGLQKYRSRKKSSPGPQFGLGGGGGFMGASSSNKVWTGTGFETRTPTKKKGSKRIVIYQ